MERVVFLLCSFSGQLRGRTTGDELRRTAPGRSVRCGGQRGCRCVHHRWHSLTGHGQTPTGKLYHLKRHQDTKKAQYMVHIEQKNTKLHTLTNAERQGGTAKMQMLAYSELTVIIIITIRGSIN